MIELELKYNSQMTLRLIIAPSDSRGDAHDVIILKNGGLNESCQASVATIINCDEAEVVKGLVMRLIDAFKVDEA